MNTILDYLEEVEGDLLHRNESEKDVTSPYGVFRYAHPDATIWEYYDELAYSIGIVELSKEWTQQDIEELNNAADPDEVRLLVSDFYEEYLEGAHLELFPVECKVAMMSMYVNSPKLGWSAVQQALVNLQKSGRLDTELYELSVVDGYYGSKTERALRKVVGGYALEDQMLFCMSGLYIGLWASSPTKYGKYLKGWNNRLLSLAQLK